jgi:hypothetical protein
MAITYEEIKALVDFPMLQKLAKGLNAFPSQLYSYDEIKKDREFKELQELLKENENYKTEKDGYVKEKKSYEDKLKIYIDKENLNSAKEKFSNLIKGLKLTDKERMFIETKFKNAKIEDLTDEGLKKFVDFEKEEFKLLVPIFNENKTYEQNNDNGNIDPKDYTKAVNNPLLDEDYDPYKA